jgi:hypothetical protein
MLSRSRGTLAQAASAIRHGEKRVIDMKSYAVRGLVAIVALSASPVIADQTHWWYLTSFSTGEVCIENVGSGHSPAKLYEFMKGRDEYKNPRIEEDNYFWLDPGAGTHVRRVRVRFQQDGRAWALYFFRTLEECQAVAKFNSVMKTPELARHDAAGIEALGDPRRLASGSRMPRRHGRGPR